MCARRVSVAGVLGATGTHAGGLDAGQGSASGRSRSRALSVSSVGLSGGTRTPCAHRAAHPRHGDASVPPQAVRGPATAGPGGRRHARVQRRRPGRRADLRRRRAIGDPVHGRPGRGGHRGERPDPGVRQRRVPVGRRRRVDHGGHVVAPLWDPSSRKARPRSASTERTGRRSRCSSATAPTAHLELKGEPPGPGEIALAGNAPQTQGLRIGDRVTLVGPSGEETALTVSGTFLPPDITDPFWFGSRSPFPPPDSSQVQPQLVSRDTALGARRHARA